MKPLPSYAVFLTLIFFQATQALTVPLRIPGRQRRQFYFCRNEWQSQSARSYAGRSIDAEGTLDADFRFKEDMALRDQDKAYECFPRLAKIVDAGEIIVPCRKGGYFCLAKINF
ncbi:MAG TPA: hypothetical protein VK518_02225 [Puia sp.]|nr:hypothetical protein [Puia sp.]